VRQHCRGQEAKDQSGRYRRILPVGKNSAVDLLDSPCREPGSEREPIMWRRHEGI